jgi:AraC-like DNA-binding protein
MPRKPNKLYYELPQFDVLGDVLRSLGLKSRVFCRAELSGPWAIEFPRQDMMHFHILERGSAWLELDAKPPPRALAPGDVMVIGSGRAFRITDQAGRRGVKPLPLPEEPLDDRFGLIRHGSAAGGTVLICGSFLFEEAAEHPLLELLPDFMHVRASSEPATAWLDLVARLLTAEVSQMRPGTQKVVSSLTDILFVQVLRQWMGEGAAMPAGWLGALQHPQIGPALAAVHERPDAVWTVDKLARRANLSRSAFSTRFAQVVGETAQAYLTRLRMQRAVRLLEKDHLSLTAIASAVGYDSEAAFNKAFKRWRGKTPGQVRREAERGPK